MKFAFDMRSMNQQRQIQPIFKQRFLPMLLSWCLVGLIYGSARFVGGEHWIIPETWVDKQIQFSTAGVWLYMAFFLWVPYAFWRAPLARIKPMAWAIASSAIISGVFFILLPSSLQYPQATNTGISDQAFAWLLWIDTEQNCFPSLHASVSLIGLLGLWQRGKFLINSLYLIILFAILFSIIQLRRHLVIDLSAGLLVGFVTYQLANKFFTNRGVIRS